MNLAGKTAFLTGSARRLGRALAIHLRKADCSIVVHYNRSEEEAKSLQAETGCRLFQADFSEISIKNLQNRLKEEIGFVDILVNNASSFSHSDWEDVGEEQWDHDMSVNLKVPFFLAHFFGRQMKVNGFGKIINLTDIAAERAYLNYLPYSVARSGVVAFTRALARALAPEVQVNAIAPGSILFPEDMPLYLQEKILSKIPAGRLCTIEEFLNTVDFLLVDVDYITGQTIILDGGRSLTW
ncbi:SDR family oxidoreductase [bacterium]|nr:SDR family oxidoreductase [bacterium]